MNMHDQDIFHSGYACALSHTHKHMHTQKHTCALSHGSIEKESKRDRLKQEQVENYLLIGTLLLKLRRQQVASIIGKSRENNKQKWKG